MEKRYNKKIVNKVIALFDFSAGDLDYKNFYKQLDELLYTGITNTQYDFMIHLTTLK